jgi:hypothetical protein
MEQWRGGKGAGRRSSSIPWASSWNSFVAAINNVFIPCRATNTADAARRPVCLLLCHQRRSWHLLKRVVQLFNLRGGNGHGGIGQCDLCGCMHGRSGRSEARHPLGVRGKREPRRQDGMPCTAIDGGRERDCQIKGKELVDINYRN